MALTWVLVGAGLLALSGIPGLFMGWRSARGQSIATLLSTSGSVLGLAGALACLSSGRVGQKQMNWSLPEAECEVALDPLGAFFLVPVFLVGGLGPIYGSRYWKQSEHPANGRRLRFFWGTLVAGMAILILARNAIVFLLGWEFMALSGFFLVATEDHEPAARRASWIYFLATHVATLTLFAMFALLRSVTGSFQLRPLSPQEAGLGTLTVIFALSLLAFGLKAGMMPLHVWLPDAHANAPSHVSAILSGVVLKMGIYGLVRFTGYLPLPPVSWGALLLLLGAASGILGVAFALGQHDLKKLLAYHSVENIGIILMGLGLAMVGRSLGRSDWILLGLGACLLHVWNHSFFKALLFFGAGSVVHFTGTREIDRMGGLAKAMPRTTAFFLLGAVAICGLPPLNGFVSEFILYTGLFRTLGLSGQISWPAAALGAPILAMIGALAVACFVKAYGAVFLGTARRPSATPVHESPVSMTGPMAVLALLCAAIGLAPSRVVPMVDQAVAGWLPSGFPGPGRTSEILPLGWISLLGFTLLAIVALSAAFLRHRARAVSSVTWDCGYARPTPRMQYTSSSFAEMLVRLFRGVLRPRSHRPHTTGVFPENSRFESHVDDAVLEGLIVPTLEKLKRRIGRARVFQHGRGQEYILYILLTLLLLFLWSLPLNELMARMLGR